MVIAAFPIPSWHDFALRLGEVQTRIHNLLTCRGHDDAGSSTAGVSSGNMAANSGARAARISGERMTISLKVNGSQRSVPAEADTPLLYVLRNDLALNGAKFGCGLAQCGPARCCWTAVRCARA
jgi:hypothetical protein